MLDGTKGLQWRYGRKPLYRRLAEHALITAIVDTPVVLIHGPRQLWDDHSRLSPSGKRRPYRSYTFRMPQRRRRRAIYWLRSRLEKHDKVTKSSAYRVLPLSNLLLRKPQQPLRSFDGSLESPAGQRFIKTHGGRMEILRLTTITDRDRARSPNLSRPPFRENSHSDIAESPR